MKTNLLIIISLLVLCAGCSDAYDGVFDMSPDERAKAKLNEYTTVLQGSEHGWLTHYYPRPQDMGGFSFVMKFSEDGKVTMNWGIRDEEQTSLYSLKMIDKPMLVFDTYCNLTKLADPDMGMGGESEFAFLRISEDKDTIYMEERVKKDPVILVRATATTWEDIKEYPQQTKILKRTDEPEVPFYYNLKVEGWKSPVTMTYYDNRQIVNLYYNEGGVNKQLMTGINFTHDGFELRNPFTREGISVRSFRYNPDTNEHIVTDPGVTGKFTHETTSATDIANIAKYYFSPGTFGEYSTYTSPKAIRLFGDMNSEDTFQGISYEPYGGVFSSLSIIFANSYINLNNPKYIIIGENSVMMEAADTYTSYYYSEEQIEAIMGSTAGKLIREFLLAPEGWTIVPCYMENQYGRYFYLISNKDPEIYFGFGDMFS